MTRSERLFQITSFFLRREFAVTAHELAARFGVSLRTVYRDISSLQRQGVPIEGAAGVGYLLRRGYKLPPLMFTNDEIDALLLGLRWAAVNGDRALGSAAIKALEKISATVPSTVEALTRNCGLVLRHNQKPDFDDSLLMCLRSSIRNEMKVRIRYRKADGTESDRTIWPVAMGYFETSRLVAAWCEMRSDFRHFRTDRVSDWHPHGSRIPTSHTELFERWRLRENLARSQTGI